MHGLDPEPAHRRADEPPVAVLADEDADWPLDVLGRAASAGQQLGCQWQRLVPERDDAGRTGEERGEMLHPVGPPPRGAVRERQVPARDRREAGLPALGSQQPLHAPGGSMRG